MKLPNIENGVIQREKVVHYLLNRNHPVGGTKAEFFEGLGFTAKEWELLAAAIQEQASTYDLASMTQETFGITYSVEGPLQTPRGMSRRIVRTVWIIPHGESVPRLVTAYPIV